MNTQPLQTLGSTLVMGDQSAVLELDERVVPSDDPLGVGLFLHATTPHAASRLTIPIGRVVRARRFACGSRRTPFWMVAVAGSRAAEVPPETQFLLVERDDNLCILLVPLVDDSFRASLVGQDHDRLAIVVDSGDPNATTNAVTGLFVAVGSDPYVLCEQAARSVARHLGSARLRREKALPAFVDQFGWCTWDAFYHDVSHDKVREGLESFVAGGVVPKLLILDDGWQSTQPRPLHTPTGEPLPESLLQDKRNQRLTGFAANEKFPGDLAPTVAMAKGEFGVETFLVWHALAGYWCGVSSESLPTYGVRDIAYDFAPELQGFWPGLTDWAGRYVSLVAPEATDSFFHDYYRHLRAQGVDGVKVDNQSTLEGAGAGVGGRVALLRRYHEAVEGAAHVHFLGKMINCMSCGSDVLYNTPSSTLTRTSDDFYPNKPESHGGHLWNNALVSLWFGEFVHPDWDMFQSGHPMGAFHAVGRAVSGGPVYVSDKPQQHDFALLQKLVLPDGSILRARGLGRPTRDCLFYDPLAEPMLLKIFNHNLASGVIGIFNAHLPDENSTTTSGVICPADVEGLEGERFVVYAHFVDELHVLDRTETHEWALAPLTAEVVTIVPIDQGIAPIGLANMLNSAGAIEAKSWLSPGHYQIRTRGPGRFLAYCEARPEQATLNGQPLVIHYDQAKRLLSCNLTSGGTLDLYVAPTD